VYFLTLNFGSRAALIRRHFFGIRYPFLRILVSC
jgi:hypothetical protein